jgi:hypothetical protein
MTGPAKDLVQCGAGGATKGAFSAPRRRLLAIMHRPNRRRIKGPAIRISTLVSEDVTARIPEHIRPGGCLQEVSL